MGKAKTFSYTPKDGGEPIVFPAHSTIRGEVDGKAYLEWLWDMDEAELPYSKQIFWYLKRSGASEEMKRRVVRLPEDEVEMFFSAWVNHEDQPEASLPPES